MKSNSKKLCALLLSAVLVVASSSSLFAKATSEEITEEQSGTSIEEKQKDEASTEKEEVIKGDEKEQDPNAPVEVKDPNQEQKDTNEVKEVEVKQQDIVKQESPVAAASLEVSNVTELNAALLTAQDGDVITLKNGFVSGKAEIKMPTSNITINGGGQVWNGGSLLVTGDGNGSLSIQNLIVDASTFGNDTALTLQNSAGQVTLKNIEIKNSTSGTLKISTGTSALTLIEDSRIHNNVSSNTGSAMYLDPDSKVTINNSTIENNTGTGSGYEGGAIASKNYRSTLTINNTVFRNNVNKMTGTVVGGGGGAMSMHYLRGKVNINDSYFVGNKTNGDETSANSTFDGGAIYVFDGRDGAEFNINRTTFDSNIAYDDGGAIMFQGTGNPGLTTNIVNCTFANNQAFGLDGAGYSGGAIQYFQNGGSSLFTNNVKSSTFVNNISGGPNGGAQQGGAIGRSGAGFFATARVSTDNSLFIGNGVYNKGVIDTASNFKDISGIQNQDLGQNNVLNADKGASAANNKDTVLGIGNAGLSPNRSGVTAGKERIVVPTVPIKPKGIADNTHTAGTAQPIDQRGYSRTKDNGAVSMSWVEYNANGGVFALGAPTPYVGTSYYETENPRQYYDVLGNGQSTTVLGDALNIQAPAGKVFIGWATTPDASVADANYAPGNPVTPQDGLELYAVYQDQSTLTVNYKDEAGTPIDTPYSVTQLSGSTHKIIAKAIDGYTFVKAVDKDGNDVAVVNNEINYIFGSTPQEITLVYRANPVESKLIVNFVDTLGNQIQTPFEISKLEGELYKLSIPSIQGFTFKNAKDALGNTIPSVSGIIDVLFGKTNQTITLVYEKEVIPDSALTIKYVDVDGNELQAQTIVKQQPDTTYEIVVPTLEKYTFKDAKDTTGNLLNPVGGKIAVQFTKQDQTITLTYVKDVVPAKVIVNYVDESGNKLQESLLKDEAVGNRFTTTIPSIKAYTFKEVKDDKGNVVPTSNSSFTVDIVSESQVFNVIYTKDKEVVKEKDKKPNTGVKSNLAASITILAISGISAIIGYKVYKKKKLDTK